MDRASLSGTPDLAVLPLASCSSDSKFTLSKCDKREGVWRHCGKSDNTYKSHRPFSLRENRKQEKSKAGDAVYALNSICLFDLPQPINTAR